MRLTHVDARPANRARIVIGDGGTIDNWTDVAVLGEPEPAQTVCEAFVDQEVQVLTASDLRARLDRACGIKDLPPIPMAARGHLLVVERELSEVDLLFLKLQEPDALKGIGKAIVTKVTRFPSAAECQAALAGLETVRQRDQAEAAEAERSWLENERQRQEDIAARACREKADIDARCAAFDGVDRAYVERACRTSERGRRCQKAKQRAMDRSMCAIEQEHIRRSCGISQASLEAIRRRQAKTTAPAAAGSSPPVCRSISTLQFGRSRRARLP